MIEFTIPGMRLVNSTNARGSWKRGHFGVTKPQRRTGYTLALHAMATGGVPTLPLIITITRIGPRALDSDNVPPSAKALRDGIADALGFVGLVRVNARGQGNDGDPRIDWRYSQSRGPYGVRVEIQAAAKEVA